MARQIQLRSDTTAAWTAANPILAFGEVGIAIDSNDVTGFKVGNGIDSWNTLPYFGAGELSSDTVLLNSQPNTPAAPGANSLKLYAKDIASREMLRIIGPSGQTTPLQPSWFQNAIYMINTSRSTAITTIGMAMTNVGTVSHVMTEVLGYMANFVSAATIGATAGSSHTDVLFMRGTLANGSNGFFIVMRLGFPDASYDSSTASTGSRIFAGLSSSAMSAVPVADSLPVNTIGFYRRQTDTGVKDTNWQIGSRDNNSTTTFVDTGIAFAVNHIYDFALFCAPGVGGDVFWQINDVTAGTSAQGDFSATLPVAATLMRPGFQVGTVDAVARNIRMNRVYAETDR